MTVGVVKRLSVLALSLVLMAGVLFVPADSSRALQQARSRVENPAGLDNFFRALTQIKSGRRIEPVRVMHYGDSHTAADILTAEIRRSFQRDFGDGGAGYMLAGNPTKSTQRRGVQSGTTSGWWTDGLAGKGAVDGIYGLAGVSISTDRAGESAWLETVCNHFEIYFLRQPGGGTIDIMVDGVSVLERPMSLNSDAPAPDYFTYDAPSDRSHRIEIRTLAPGRTRILGIVTEHIAPGVSYDVLGINGARANRLLSWNDTAFVDNLVQRKPDLIIIAYGTNEVSDTDWSVESYQRMFANILRRFRRAAPQASIIVYGPPDRADVDVSSKMPAMIEAQKRAAYEVGAAFWSSYAAMGGAGSMNLWAQQGLGQGDRVHLTSAGYIRMGGMFYNDLMLSYNDYKTRAPRSTRRQKQ